MKDRLRLVKIQVSLKREAKLLTSDVYPIPRTNKHKFVYVLERNIPISLSLSSINFFEIDLRFRKIINNIKKTADSSVFHFPDYIDQFPQDDVSKKLLINHMIVLNYTIGLMYITGL